MWMTAQTVRTSFMRSLPFVLSRLGNTDMSHGAFVPSWKNSIRKKLLQTGQNWRQFRLGE